MTLRLGLPLFGDQVKKEAENSSKSLSVWQVSALISSLTNCKFLSSSTFFVSKTRVVFLHPKVPVYIFLPNQNQLCLASQEKLEDTKVGRVIVWVMSDTPHYVEIFLPSPVYDIVTKKSSFRFKFSPSLYFPQNNPLQVWPLRNFFVVAFIFITYLSFTGWVGKWLSRFTMYVSVYSEMKSMLQVFQFTKGAFVSVTPAGAYRPIALSHPIRATCNSHP